MCFRFRSAWRRPWAGAKGVAKKKKNKNAQKKVTNEPNRTPLVPRPDTFGIALLCH
jgi:hypothetical protein